MSPASGARHVVALAGLLLALSLTRLAGLDARLPHHDEMVHLSMSETLAAKGTYRAEPAYHGPLLYHLEAAVLRVAGSGLWQARLVPALAGVAAALALVLLAWRESGRRAAAGVALLVTLSPSWLYYSRFNAHDSLILLMTVVVAWGRWQWARGATRAATWLIVLALALAASTKLNALFLGGAIALWPLVRRVAAGRDHRAPPLRWPRPLTLTCALGVAGLVVAALFATTYRAHLPEGGPAAAVMATLRAALVDPVVHWTGSHRQQRLGGPFHFYALILAICEPLLVLGAGLALVQGWRQSQRTWRAALVLVGLGVGMAAACWPIKSLLQRFAHLHPIHLIALPLLAFALWTLVRQRAREGDEAGVWWAWMAATQTLLYGYAGEKVPWLTVHVALPWMMLAGPALAQWWAELPAWTDRGAPLADQESGTEPRGSAPGRVAGLLLAAAIIVSVLVTAHGALALATWNRSNVGEPLVQLEYAPDTHALLARLAEVCPRLALTESPCLVTTADAGWPAQYYLRTLPPGAVVTGLEIAQDTTPFVFAPARRDATAQTQPAFDATHEPQPARFTSWGTWVAWAHRPRPAALLRFWVWRQSLGPRRGVPYELWVRRDLAGVWSAGGVR